HLRVEVADLAEVARTRVRPELREQAVRAVLRAPLRDLRLGVVEIAEDDRAGGAGVLAGGPDVAVLDRLAGALALDLPLLDPLHAVRALLHHAAHADRDVRVVTHALDLGDVLVGAAARVVVEE